MQRESQKVTLLRWAVILNDLVILNLLLTVFYWLSPGLYPALASTEYHLVYFVFNVIYLLCVSWKKPVVYMRKVRPEEIVARSFVTVFWFGVLSFLTIDYLEGHLFSWAWVFTFYPALCVGILVGRLVAR